MCFSRKMRQADRRRRLRATITTKRHLQMAPRTTQTIPSSPLLALFVLLGFRLGIRARVVITHAAWVVASAMARAEARTGVRTTRRAAADVQRECYVSSDASGGASGGVVGGARCCACARQRAAEQQAQKHTRRADRELRQQRKADFPQTRRAPPRASRCARRASARPHVVRPPRAGARVRGWSEGAAHAERRTGREKKQGGGGEEHAARERPCSTAAVKNHPQRTRAARVACASPIAPRAPLPRSARSGDRREDARRGRRPSKRKTRRGPPRRAMSVLK